MTVRLDGDVIHLEGECYVEQAEVLLGLLQADATRRVDLGLCRHLHGALAQVLLGFGAKVGGDPVDPFLRDFVLPGLQR